MSNRLSSDAKLRSHAFRVVLLLLVISFCCAVLAACDTSSSNAQTGSTEGEKLLLFTMISLRLPYMLAVMVG